jgi:hypothetical protein
MKKLFLLELNEINFDAVNHYLKKGENLPGFKKVSENILITKSEKNYKNLEPWIQWPSIHTGKTFEQHKVFRLGDFVKSKEDQFFEKVEKAGYFVGAVSPMNASNKLKKPAYFIPDPWTKTPSDNSFLSKILSDSISQAVNDNAQSKINFMTIIKLILAFIWLVNPARFFHMFKYVLLAARKPWRKALFLDKFLFEVHKTLYKRKKPNFSTIFLNAGAHIQHHYFFNSSFSKSSKLINPTWYIKQNEDPFLEMLKVYDEMLLNVLNLPDTELIIATGLSQRPFNYIKYYYRLKNHKLFLKDLDIKFTDVFPRMTRDFLITFDTEEQATQAETKLSNIVVNDDIKLFGEIDNRGKDIFVVLTFPHEVVEKTVISLYGKKLFLKKYVSFVAIKNGEHQSKGFVFFSKGILKFAPPDGSHVSMINRSILQFFSI